MKGFIQLFSDRTLLVTFFLSVTIAAIGYAMGKSWQSIPFGLAERFILPSGLCLILKHSGFVYEHRHVRVVYLCASVIFIGALFKLESWPGGSLMLITGISVVIVTYSVRFLSKKTKRPLDFLKMLWVAAYYTHAILRIENYPGANEMHIVAFVLFFLMIGLFLFEKREVLMKSFKV